MIGKGLMERLRSPPMEPVYEQALPSQSKEKKLRWEPVEASDQNTLAYKAYKLSLGVNGESSLGFSLVVSGIKHPENSSKTKVTSAILEYLAGEMPVGSAYLDSEGRYSIDPPENNLLKRLLPSFPRYAITDGLPLNVRLNLVKVLKRLNPGFDMDSELEDTIRKRLKHQKNNS